MSGARRTARHRAAGRDRGTLAGGLVAVVLFAAAVTGIVVSVDRGTVTTIPALTVGGAVPVRVAGAAVVTGSDRARVRLDVYEDLLSPACGQFAGLYSDPVEQRVRAGTVRVTYHVLPFLDEHSSPAGYSGRAANAALAVAVDAPDRFPGYLRSLFAAQPPEGGAGYSDEELISLGRRLGVGGRFADDVRTGRYRGALDAALRAALPVLAKANHGNPTMPTVLSGDQPQQWAAPAPGGRGVAPTRWLDRLLAA